MKTITKEAIIQFNARNEVALKEIYNVLYKPLCLYSSGITKDYQESEDAVQVCFVKLWQSDRTIEDESHLKQLLYTMVRNESINYIRAAYTRRVRDANSSQEPTFDWLYEYEGLYESYSEHLDSIFSLIETLPAACKQVMQLKLQGHTTKEVCEITGMQAATVRSQQRYAINKIKTIWKPAV